MRPPLLLNPLFQFDTSEEFLAALGIELSPGERANVESLVAMKLPPAISGHALSTLTGLHLGLIWSFAIHTRRHYRLFEIPKGKGVRRIAAPKVGLKLVQGWFARNWSNGIQFKPHVFGFVPGRSHICAASVHCSARWTFGVDIRDFFQTTPEELVKTSLVRLGYPAKGAGLIARICCLNGFLAQGAPSSPFLSNLCFQDTDEELEKIASQFGVRVTRYADDIVFSGADACPAELPEAVKNVFDTKCWTLAEDKTEFYELPKRLKVHGLLVHGERPRLTKGYRNKLRAYEHLYNAKRIRPDDSRRVLGHLAYAKSVNEQQF